MGMSRLWLAVSVIVLAALYALTGASLSVFDARYLLLSSALFLVSTALWSLGWSYVMRCDAWEGLKLNAKSLAGIFSPMGAGSDLMRTILAKRHPGMRADKALAASVVVKFFKSVIMFYLLLVGVLLLASRTYDFSQNILLFAGMAATALLGMLSIIMLRWHRTIAFANIFVRKVFLWRFHRQLNITFRALTWAQILALSLILSISTIFEIAAVWAAFMCIGHSLPWLHIFIFSSVAYSLMQVSLSPQGIGLVEAGGYLVLSLGYFSMPRPAIGSFLIAWSIIRLWIPSLIGFLLIMASGGKK